MLEGWSLELIDSRFRHRHATHRYLRTIKVAYQKLILATDFCKTICKTKTRGACIRKLKVEIGREDDE
jgi:hypothetical protein